MTGKRLLADTLDRPLPEAIVRHPKQGFTLPFARWMEGDLAPFVRDGMRRLSDAGWVAPGVPDAAWDQLAPGRVPLEPSVGPGRARTFPASVIASDLSAFEHRLSYDGETGRDRWEVRIVNAWVRATVPPLLASVAPGPVIDAGCGEQPFRALVEAHARQYVGMDVVQNSSRSVDGAERSRERAGARARAIPSCCAPKCSSTWRTSTGRLPDCGG